MKTVFENGTESQILFMLKKLQEINDKRFVNDVQKLLKHPSDKIKTAAIQNMYFLNNATLVSEVSALLKSDNEDLVLATLEYLLLHESKDNRHIYNEYLNHENIKSTLLFCAPSCRVRAHILPSRRLHRLCSIQLRQWC